MRIYLDNCCYNRPFDDQSSVRVRLEAEAKMHIQQQIIAGKIEPAWSYILDFENDQNPFPERQRAIALWRSRAVIDASGDVALVADATALRERGLSSKDALHVACAIRGNCSHFITTDDHIIRRIASIERITVIDPIGFVKVLEETQ